MDCKTARLLLDYARPQPAELTGADAAALEGHLAGCADCDAVARGERQADDQLGRAVRDVPVPEGLRDRLLDLLAAERRAWYRRRLRWAAPAAAAVAAAMIFALVHYWPRPNRPVPYLEQVALDVQEQVAQGRSPDGVADWFAAHYGLTVSAPQDFGNGPLDYGLLTYYDLGYFQGQRAPLLLFTRGTAQARVYVLSDRQFNLAEDQDDKDSGLIVLFRRHPQNPHVVYVIVLSGTRTLEPFLTRPPGNVG